MAIAIESTGFFLPSSGGCSESFNGMKMTPSRSVSTFASGASRKGGGWILFGRGIGVVCRSIASVSHTQLCTGTQHTVPSSCINPNLRSYNPHTLIPLESAPNPFVPSHHSRPSPPRPGYSFSSDRTADYSVPPSM